MSALELLKESMSGFLREMSYDFIYVRAHEQIIVSTGVVFHNFTKIKKEIYI